MAAGRQERRRVTPDPDQHRPSAPREPGARSRPPPTSSPPAKRSDTSTATASETSARTVDARIVRDAAADPKPPRITDRGKSTDELDDDAYWAKVSAALHLLLDVKVKIADGVQPPAHIAILMQILVPEQDWDEALRQEIGNLL